MKHPFLAILCLSLGCGENSTAPKPQPTASHSQLSAKRSTPEASIPEWKDTDYELVQDAGGFKAAPWDTSPNRLRFYGEPGISSWAIQWGTAQVTISGATRSTNSGSIVGKVKIYGGNLAVSQVLAHIGTSNPDGHFTVNISRDDSISACRHLYTGGIAEPIREYSIPVQPKRTEGGGRRTDGGTGPPR